MRRFTGQYAEDGKQRRQARGETGGREVTWTRTTDQLPPDTTTVLARSGPLTCMAAHTRGAWYRVPDRHRMEQPLEWAALEPEEEQL